MSDPISEVHGGGGALGGGVPEKLPDRPIFTPPPTPAAIAVDTGANPIIQILQYRTQALQWSAEYMNIIGAFIDAYNSGVLAERVPGVGADESRYRLDMSNLTDALAKQIKPSIDGLMEFLNKFLAEIPVLDVQGLIDKISAAIEAQITLDQRDIPIFRTLLKNMVNMAMLDGSYSVLNTDLDIINTFVAEYKKEAISELNEQMFLIERVDKDTLISTGRWDSDIAADWMSRTMQRKGRLLKEIDNKAIQFQRQYLNDAYNRAIERVRSKIQAVATISPALYNLPPGLYTIIGDMLYRRFPDIGQLAGFLPALAEASVRGLGDLIKIAQADRIEGTRTDVDTDKMLVGLAELYMRYIAQTMEGAAKLATLEAS